MSTIAELRQKEYYAQQPAGKIKRILKQARTAHSSVVDAGYELCHLLEHGTPREAAAREQKLEELKTIATETGEQEDYEAYSAYREELEASIDVPPTPADIRRRLAESDPDIIKRIARLAPEADGQITPISERAIQALDASIIAARSWQQEIHPLAGVPASVDYSIQPTLESLGAHITTNREVRASIETAFDPAFQIEDQQKIPSAL